MNIQCPSLRHQYSCHLSALITLFFQWASDGVRWKTWLTGCVSVFLSSARDADEREKWIHALEGTILRHTLQLRVWNQALLWMRVFLSNPLQLTEELFAPWILWCLPAIYTNSRRTVRISELERAALCDTWRWSWFRWRGKRVWKPCHENNIRAFTAVCICINYTRTLVMDLNGLCRLSAL